MMTEQIIETTNESSDEVVVNAQHLIKRFSTRNGEITAVNDISLKITKGEIFGLIGPDGAGKTTLSRLILGLLKPTQGSSSIFGYDVIKQPYQVRERIGYVAQQFTTPPELTVYENMRFFADAEGLPRETQEKRIDQLLDFIGLSSAKGRVTKRLSGGMKKKLALACALLHEPNFLVLDEPTLGVDPISRRDFWTILSELRTEKGMAIFVCTPYMDEAERCTRVGMINHGSILINDIPSNIKKQAPGELLEINPGTGNFDSVKEIVDAQPYILESQVYGARIHAFVDHAVERTPELSKAIEEKGIEPERIRQINPSLEEVFVSFITKQRAEEEKERLKKASENQSEKENQQNGK